MPDEYGASRLSILVVLGTHVGEITVFFLYRLESMKDALYITFDILASHFLACYDFRFGAHFMPLQDEVRDLIGDLYDGVITPRQFREAFAPLFFQSDTYISEFHDLFIEIDAVYAQFLAGRIDEAALRKNLFELSPSTRVRVPEASNSVDVWRLVYPTTNASQPLPSRRTSTTPVSPILIRA